MTRRVFQVADVAARAGQPGRSVTEVVASAICKGVQRRDVPRVLTNAVVLPSLARLSWCFAPFVRWVVWTSPGFVGLNDNRAANCDDFASHPDGRRRET
jgi:hypothetical protein